MSELTDLQQTVSIAVEVLRRVEEKVDRTNGLVAQIKEDHLRLEGAVGVLRQLVVFGVPTIVAIAAVSVAIIGLYLR